VFKAVAGNVTENVSVFPALVLLIVPAVGVPVLTVGVKTVKLWVLFAVKTTVAVYAVLKSNVVGLPLQLMLVMLKPVSGLLREPT
jgi:hypothetical protein